MKKSIGVQLKVLRELRGFSLEKLSNVLGFISKQSLSAYEQDKSLCPLDVLVDILEVLKGQLVVLNGEVVIDTIEEFERRKNLPNKLGEGTPGAFWLTKDCDVNKEISKNISQGIFNTMDALNKVFDKAQHTGGGFFGGYKIFNINNEDCVIIFSNEVVVLGKGIKNTYLTLDELLEIEKSQDMKIHIKHSPYEYGNYHNLIEFVDNNTIVVEDLFLSFPKKIQKEIIRYFNLFQKYINTNHFVDYTTLDEEDGTIQCLNE